MMTKNNKDTAWWMFGVLTIILVVLIIVVVVVIIMIGKLGQGGGAGKAGSQTYTTPNAWKYAEDIKAAVPYRVVRVVDGDTLVADVLGHALTIRLIGADTPETVDPRKPVQCYGPEASAKAKELLASTSVYLEKDPTKGDYEKYGRVLAYVWFGGADSRSGGTLYNEYMIKAGYAHEYTYMHEAYKYQADFKADERAAKKAKLGLWGKCQGGSVDAASAMSAGMPP